MIYIAIAFISGMMTKIADNYSELERGKKFWVNSALIGLLYGSAIVSAVFLNQELMPLIAGIVVGNAFAGKVDALEHIIAVSIILGIIAMQIQSGISVEFTALAVFSVSAFADETLPFFIKHKAVKLRLITPIVALLYAVLHIYSYALYIIAFDVGYKIIAKLSKTL